MCGLIGLIRAGTTANAGYKAWLKQALVVDTLRGFDSTGLGVLSDNWEPLLYKKVMPGFDFIQMPTTTRMIDKFSSSKVFIGHNRAATRGAVNMANAHPFFIDNIMLAHNGTLTGNLDYLKSSYLVDSAKITEAFANDQTGRFVSVLEQLTGAYALSWLDARQHTFYLARNSERPLWLAFSRDKEVMLYASEEWMISSLAKRLSSPSIEIESTIELPVGEMWEWNLESKKVDELTKTKFTVKQQNVISYHTSTPHYHGGRGNRKEQKIPLYNQFGLAEGDIVPIELDEFVAYQSDPSYGSCRGNFYLMPKEEFGASVILYAQSAERHEKLKDTILQAKLTDAQLIEEDGKKIVRFTCVEPKGASTMLLARWGDCIESILPFDDEIPLPSAEKPSKNAGDNSGNEPFRTTISPPLPPKKEERRKEKGGWVVGPRNMDIPIATFLDITQGGCAVCKKKLSPTEAPYLSWTQDWKPVCAPCNKTRYPKAVH